MALPELAEEAADADRVRETLLSPVAERSFDRANRMKAGEGRKLAIAAERVMDADVETLTAAAKGARGARREAHCNGLPRS